MVLHPVVLDKYPNDRYAGPFAGGISHRSCPRPRPLKDGWRENSVRAIALHSQRPAVPSVSWTRGAGPAGNRAWRSSSLFSAHPGPPDSPPAPGQFGWRLRDSASHISSMVPLEESSVRTSQTSGARRGSWPQMPGHPMGSVFSGLFGARSARAGAALENRLSLKKAARIHHSSPTSRNCEYRFFPPTCSSLAGFLKGPIVK